MKWSYNKEKPWLSGMMNRPDTQRWIMLKTVAGQGNLYYAGGNKWSHRRIDAKYLDNEERGFLAQHKADGHWFELVHD